jgi:hypothetical protein
MHFEKEWFTGLNEAVNFAAFRCTGGNNPITNSSAVFCCNEFQSGLPRLSRHESTPIVAEQTGRRLLAMTG